MMILKVVFHTWNKISLHDVFRGTIELTILKSREI